MARKRFDGSFDEATSEPLPLDEAPANAAPEAPAPAPEAAPAPSERDLPRVTLQVFLTAHPLRLDQTAGFQRWAQSHHPGKHTIPAWDGFLAAFNQRPIR